VTDISLLRLGIPIVEIVYSLYSNTCFQPLLYSTIVTIVTIDSYIVTYV
jgi:hypothetical protein